MDSQNEKTLFDTYQMGDLTLSNRIGVAALVMAIAKSNNDPKINIPTDYQVKFLSERTDSGFIITECSAISKQGYAYLGSAGIWNKEQTEAWKKVVDAVHNKGGLIIHQIFHGGRRVNPADSGEKSLAPSAIPRNTYDKEGKPTPTHVPTAMTVNDINSVLEEYHQAALRVKEAGFDGVELHAANGYLVDEFLRDGTNKRTDEYGGSVENRARFCLEAIDQLISVFGKGRVGIKLSPVERLNDMFDSNPLQTFTYLLQKLDEKGIAFVELTEPPKIEEKTCYIEGKEQIPEVAKAFRGAFTRTLITNKGHTPETALDYINKGWADLVTFGNLFIANPDLVNKIKNGSELNQKWEA